MPNPRLTAEQLEILANPLLNEVRLRLLQLAGDDVALYWALRRKLAKELTYDERGKPIHRRALKAKKRGAQNGMCAVCASPLPDRDVVLDRFEAVKGYTIDNTQLICRACDTAKQERLGYTDGTPHE